MADTKLEQLAQLTGLNNSLKTLEDMEKLSSEILKSINSMSGAEQTLANNLYKNLELKRQALVVLQEEQEEIQSEIKSISDKSKLIEKQIELEKNILKQKKITAEEDLESLKKQKEKIKQLEKEKELLEEINKKRKVALETASKTLNSITLGMSEQFKGMFKLDDFNNKLQERVKVLTDLNKGIAETGAVFQGDISTFGKMLGDEYLGKYGVRQQDVIESYGQLRTSMASFSEMDMKTQELIASHTTKMKNFQISAEAVGKNYDILTKGLKMSGKEVTQFSDKLMQHAIGAGIAPKKMVEEFANAAPKLLAYGAKAGDVFIALQKQAKSLGMEMSSLTNIVGDQFDTFEGSAKAAGKLNAVLGGNYLNSVEMLNASEEERIMLIKQAMDESGKSFDSLDKYEKKALASTLGITDMAEASKVLGGSTQELQKDMDKSAKSQDELNSVQKAARDQAKAMDAQYDHLNSSADTFRKTNDGIADAISKMNEQYDGMYGKILMATQAIFAYKDALLGILPTFGSLKEHIGGLKEKLGGIFSKTKQAASQTEELGEAGSKAGGKLGSSAGKIMAFGVAIALVGVGIGAAAYGFSFLVKSFKDLTGQQILGALGAMIIVMGGMALAISILAAASLPAAGPLLALGAAMALLSFPILAVGKALEWAGPAIAKILEVLLEGLKKIVGAIGGVIEKIFGGIEKIIYGMTYMMSQASFEKAAALMAVAVGIAAVSAAMAGQAVAGAVSSAIEGVTKFLGGQTVAQKMQEFFNVLNTVDTAKLQAFAAFSQSMGSASTGTAAFADALVRMSPGIVQFSSSLNSLPENKIWAFKAFTDGVSSIRSDFVETFSRLPTFLGEIISMFERLTFSIKSVKDEIKSIPTESLDGIKSLANTMDRFKTFTEEQLKPTKNFLANAKEYYLAQANSKDADNDALIQAIRQMTGAVESTRKQSDSTEVKLIIQGEDLARALRYGDTPIKAILTGLKG